MLFFKCKILRKTKHFSWQSKQPTLYILNFDLWEEKIHCTGERSIQCLTFVYISLLIKLGNYLQAKVVIYFVLFFVESFVILLQNLLQVFVPSYKYGGLNWALAISH